MKDLVNRTLLGLGAGLVVYGLVIQIVRNETGYIKDIMMLAYWVPGWTLIAMGYIGRQLNRHRA